MIIKNGLVVDPALGLSEKMDLAIENGTILKIGKNIDTDQVSNDTEVLDATGLVVAPGLIDTHVHFRDPGFTYKEDLHTGALAAAKGGFTSVICMANTSPVVDSLPVLKDLIDREKNEDIRIFQAAAISCSLKGKEAVFKCTVHEIKAKELPEIDDEFAAEVSEFDTLEEYKADVKAKIKEQKAAEGKAKQEDQVVEQAVKNATYELPEAMVETQAEQMANDFAQRMQSQGLTMEQYFQFTGTTAEQMMEDLKPQAVKRIETRLVLEAIAKAENIEISDEKLDEEIGKMAEAYKMEADKLKEFMGENEKKQMKEDMAVQEAITFLVDNAVEK